MMDVKEQSQLIETINDLVRGSNGWDTIKKFFNENEEIQPILKEVERELINDGCYSQAIIYVTTIEKLLAGYLENQE